MITRTSADVALADLTAGPYAKNYFPCVEITTGRAIYLQLADKNAAGETLVLIDTPQFYMPENRRKGYRLY